VFKKNVLLLSVMTIGVALTSSLKAMDNDENPPSAPAKRMYIYQYLKPARKSTPTPKAQPNKVPLQPLTPEEAIAFVIKNRHAFSGGTYFNK